MGASGGSMRVAGIVSGLCLTLAMAGCSRSAQSHVERGDAALARGDESAAVLEYRNAVSKDPRLAGARLKLSDLYSRRGDGDAALAEAVRAADLLPNDGGAQVKAGALLLAAGKLDDALSRAENALALNSANDDALALKAMALGGKRDLENAVRDMEAAIRIAPRARHLGALGALRFARGELPEAEAAYRRAVEAEPTSAEARVGLAQFLWAAGRTAEAEAAFKAALTSDAKNRAANQWMAEFLVTTGRAFEAEPYMKMLAETAGANLRPRFGLADYYVATQRPAEALRVLEGLKDTRDAWRLARPRIAAITYDTGRQDDAHRTVDAVIAEYPTYAEPFVVRARFYLLEDRVDAAVADAREAVKHDPSLAATHKVLGDALQAAGDVGGAASAYKEVLRLTPRETGAQITLAGLELRRGAYGGAAQLAEAALSRAPGSLQARLVLARSLLAAGDLDRAVPVTQSLVEAFPQVAAVQVQAGLVAMATKDAGEARRALERAASLDPQNLEAVAGLARLDLRDGRTDGARARVLAQVAKSPAHAPSLLVAAGVLREAGLADEAESLLRRAIDAAPDNVTARVQLGQTLLAQKRPAEALQQYEAVLARDPLQVDAATTAAQLLESMGRVDQARTRYEAIVSRHPDAYLAANNLAYLYASRAEQLDRALELAQMAKRGLPDSPAIDDTLGFVYLKKQLGGLAIPLLERAATRLPQEPTVRYHLALAHAQAGNREKALEALKAAFGLASEFEGSGAARRLMQELQGS